MNKQIRYCAKCEIEVTLIAKCSCNVGYITPGELALRAVAANPQMSARAIAQKTGIPHATVSRARQSTVSNETVGKRIGIDGKARRNPTLSLRPSSPSMPPSAPLPPPVAAALVAHARSRSRTLIKREPTLEQRIVKLEKLYGQIVKLRRTGYLPRAFLRNMKALLHQPNNVSEAKLNELRAEWDIAVWLLASESSLPTPSLTDAGIVPKEKVHAT